jgi:NAD(P)-dependent dehydrogenase (short-subunit alcohol dehydrogenase family)
MSSAVERAVERAVVVTGVSSGIGAAAVRAALDGGARVFGSVRTTSDAARAQAEFGERFTPLVFDVTDAAAVSAAAEVVRAALAGRALFGLVNNAGVATPGPLLHQPFDEWRNVLEVNVLGVVRVLQAFAPLVCGRAPGRIVNIGSVSGRVAWPMLSAYAASKHALEAVTDALRREMIVHGVDVIMVAPGAVRTPIWEKARRRDMSRYDGTAYVDALGRYGEFVDDSERAGIPVEQVGALIWRALTTKRPRARYAPAPNPWVNALLPLLPRRWLDRIAARVIGLRPVATAAQDVTISRIPSAVRPSATASEDKNAENRCDRRS